MRRSTAAVLVIGALVLGLALGSVSLAYANPEGADAQGKAGFLSVITDLLGLTEDEFREAKQEGRSLPSIAEEAGVPSEELVDEMHSRQMERLQGLYEEGLITEEQLEWADESLRERVEDRLMSDGMRGGPPGGYMGGGHMDDGRMGDGHMDDGHMDDGAGGPGDCMGELPADTPTGGPQA